METRPYGAVRPVCVLTIGVLLQRRSLSERRASLVCFVDGVGPGACSRLPSNGVIRDTRSHSSAVAKQEERLIAGTCSSPALADATAVCGASRVPCFVSSGGGESGANGCSMPFDPPLPSLWETRGHPSPCPPVSSVG